MSYFKGEYPFVEKPKRCHAINRGEKKSPMVGEYYGPVYTCENCKYGDGKDEYILPGFKLCPNCGYILNWDF